MDTMSNSDKYISIEFHGPVSEDNLVTTTSISKVLHPDGDLAISVSTPRVVDANQANIAAGLLFDAIYQLPSTPIIETIKFCNLRLTPEGVTGIEIFLAIFSSTIKRVVLKQVVPENSQRLGPEKHAIELLGLAFAHSKLEVLDLSDNLLELQVWQTWKTQRNLQQLILDHVFIEEDSFYALANIDFYESLEDLHIVLRKPAKLHSGNCMLASCKRLNSLRWIYDEPEKEAKLPLQGIRDMINNTLSASISLMYLVLQGSNVTNDEIDTLCEIINKLPNLSTLKLRRLQLNDTAGEQIVNSFSSEAPLICVDLSYNEIGSLTSKAILDWVTSHDHKWNQSRRTLIVQQNCLVEEDALLLYDALLQNNTDWNICLDSNNFDWNHLVVHLMTEMHQAAAEREELRRHRNRLRTEAKENEDHMRKLVSGQTAILQNLQSFQHELEKLGEERDLLRTFLGLCPEEKRDLFDRVEKLEQRVYGESGSCLGYPLRNDVST